MKTRMVLISLALILTVEITALCLFAAQDTDGTQDAVMVNEAVRSVEADWMRMENHKNITSLDYVVLDGRGDVLFQTKPGLSESINRAVSNRDTILDIAPQGEAAGKIIIYNDSGQKLRAQKQKVIIGLVLALFIQCAICGTYVIYLQRAVVHPFHGLKSFAQRVAGGNLDIPLEMDKKNIFGAFTESFDIMRSELKKARIAEAKANASKKELVAKLSHDIKTPVASIKAASEVGAALTDNEKIRENYMGIIRKADQINALITNLFTATLEELNRLTVVPEDMESRELKTLLKNADYLQQAELPDIPDAVLFADQLRLQQVFDNLFANSYKYAGTKIQVTIHEAHNHLAVSVEDYGGGVSKEELPLLKEKFKRGSNAKHIEGAGLGLYLSQRFMKEMRGELVVENGDQGLKVTVIIALSGVI
ncbi:MAG: HAMP domain-containing histidine kinase [Firmicutes bacterium]|nr:HAMP domain-containing histidine kinase [Bacillota bacterium]NBI63599.1 sensor histidine kinase [Clostridiales bacterium]